MNESLWLILDSDKLEELLSGDTDRDTYTVDLIRSEEPPISNDEGIVQVPLGEILQVALHSAFNADKELI